MLLLFLTKRRLLGRQRGPPEHRGSGALTGPRVAHLLALTIASRPGIPATVDAALGLGPVGAEHQALVRFEREKAKTESGTHTTLQQGLYINKQDHMHLTSPHGAHFDSSQGTDPKGCQLRAPPQKTPSSTVGRQASAPTPSRSES